MMILGRGEENVYEWKRTVAPTMSPGMRGKIRIVGYPAAGGGLGVRDVEVAFPGASVVVPDVTHSPYERWDFAWNGTYGSDGVPIYERRI